jgi:uncharacterized membrane protein
MGGKIRSAISNGQLGRSISGTLAALSASAALVMMPTKASAFDAKYEAGLAPRGGLAQASERDAAADQGPGSVGRSTTRRRSNRLADRQSLSHVSLELVSTSGFGPRDLRLRWFSCD